MSPIGPTVASHPHATEIARLLALSYRIEWATIASGPGPIGLKEGPPGLAGQLQMHC